MKSVATDHPKKERTFPRLMIAPLNVIILMVGTGGPQHLYGKGVVVASSINVNPIGYYSESWHLDTLRDYEGSVTLSND
jgi:hypothetical protein